MVQAQQRAGQLFCFFGQLRQDNFPALLIKQVGTFLSRIPGRFRSNGREAGFHCLFNDFPHYQEPLADAFETDVHIEKRYPDRASHDDEMKEAE